MFPFFLALTILSVAALAVGTVLLLIRSRRVTREVGPAAGAQVMNYDAASLPDDLTAAEAGRPPSSAPAPGSTWRARSRSPPESRPGASGTGATSCWWRFSPLASQDYSLRLAVPPHRPGRQAARPHRPRARHLVHRQDGPGLPQGLTAEPDPTACHP